MIYINIYDGYKGWSGGRDVIVMLSGSRKDIGAERVLRGKRRAVDPAVPHIEPAIPHN